MRAYLTASSISWELVKAIDNMFSLDLMSTIDEDAIPFNSGSFSGESIMFSVCLRTPVDIFRPSLLFEIPRNEDGAPVWGEPGDMGDCGDDSWSLPAGRGAWRKDFSFMSAWCFGRWKTSYISYLFF